MSITPLERASGIVLGVDPNAQPLSASEPGLSAREAIERAIVPALERPPCIVAFSGGRDSSAVLAVAVHVSRSMGLVDPIPVTVRFPHVPNTVEDPWQELVVSYLGVRDWVKLEFTDELDLVGPYAQPHLLSRSVMWPPNAHMQIPIFEQARGGSVINGFDGDGVFGSWRWKPLDELLVRPWRLRADQLRMGASAVLPRTVAERVMAGRWRLKPAWLTSDASRQVARGWARQQLREPVRWRGRVDYFSRLRRLRLCRETVSRLGDQYDVEANYPILDRQFLAALAGEWHPGRFSSRTATMRYLFGDLLPTEVIERRTKAEFGHAFFGETSRAFAQSWDGVRGIDLDLVDPEELRAAWLSDRVIDFRSAAALQDAWLASQDRANVV